jgi:phage terminase Nu1 subunit (DNA packaging protein)
MSTIHIVRRPEAQKILGLAARSFARLEAEGVIVPSSRGRPGKASSYDLAVVVPQYIQHLKSVSGQSAERAARARRDLAVAKLNELKLRERRGELAEVKDVGLRWSEIAVGVRNAILGAPSALKQCFPDLKIDVVLELDRILRDILTRLADGAEGEHTH